MDTIAMRKNGLYLLALLTPLFTISGCSQNKHWIKVDHPGDYELIEMGHQQDGPIVFRLTRAHDRVFYSHPTVLGPTSFSVYLLQHTEIHEGESVLDMGTGSGIQAIYAAEKASHVLAMDINEIALDNTLKNARKHRVADKISVRGSNLFDALHADEKFDVIISSIPYAWNEQTQGNWKLQERFFQAAGKHLNPTGRIYFLTGSLDNLSRTKQLIEENGLKIMRMDMAYAPVQELEPIVYVLQHAPAAPNPGAENAQ